MSQTEATELLGAVRGFLRERLLPQLEGFEAYNTRVAANSLAILAREVELGPAVRALDTAAAARWATEAAGDPLKAISLALRKRHLTPDVPFLDYLRERTLRQMAIDNPRYSGFLQGCERWPALAAAAAVSARNRLG